MTRTRLTHSQSLSVSDCCGHRERERERREHLTHSLTVAIIIWPAQQPSLTHSLTVPTLTHSHSHSHSQLPLTHSLTFTNSLSLTHFHSLTFTHFHSLSLTHSRSQSVSQSGLRSVCCLRASVGAQLSALRLSVLSQFSLTHSLFVCSFLVRSFVRSFEFITD